MIIHASIFFFFKHLSSFGDSAFDVMHHLCSYDSFVCLVVFVVVFFSFFGLFLYFLLYFPKISHTVPLQITFSYFVMENK